MTSGRSGVGVAVTMEPCQKDCQKDCLKDCQKFQCLLSSVLFLPYFCSFLFQPGSLQLITIDYNSGASGTSTVFDKQLSGHLWSSHEAMVLRMRLESPEEASRQDWLLDFCCWFSSQTTGIGDISVTQPVSLVCITDQPCPSEPNLTKS